MSGNGTDTLGGCITTVFASSFGGITNSSSEGEGSTSKDTFSACGATAKPWSRPKPGISSDLGASFFSASYDMAGSSPILKLNSLVSG